VDAEPKPEGIENRRAQDSSSPTSPRQGLEEAEPSWDRRSLWQGGWTPPGSLKVPSNTNQFYEKHNPKWEQRGNS